MNKRIISLIAVFAMIFQTMTAVFGAEDTSAPTATSTTAAEEEEYLPYIKSVEFLNGFGIIDEEIGYSETVTRGGAAKLIAAMLDEDENLQGYRGIFADVSQDNENALYIEKLADLGIVHGDEDFKYRPDDVLTYDEAAYMFAYTLGYGLAQDERYTPQNAVTRFGIPDGINKKTDFVLFGDMAVMMKNALLSGMFLQETYGSDPYIVKTDATLLYKVYDIRYTNGVISKDDLTSLWSSNGADDGYMYLETGDESIKLKADDFSKIRRDLGKSVRVYYKIGSSDENAKYVYHEVDDYTRTIDISLERIETGKSSLQSNGSIEYYANEKKSNNARLASSINIIYNGTAYKADNFDLSKVKDKVGSVELIDADSNGAYETAKITVYDTVIVNNVSTEHHYITDKYLADNKVDTDTDNYTRIFVYDQDGNETDLSAIVSGCTLSVAKSDSYTGDNVLTIRISTNNINGKITKYKKGTFTPYIIIDGENTFDLRDRALKEDCEENSNIIAYIDVFGNIVYLSDDYTRDMQYGMLAGISKLGGGFSPVITVRLISLSGDVNEYNLDSKVIIDGTNYKGKEADAYNTLKGIKFDMGLSKLGTLPDGVYPVRFKLSDDGTKIKKIDTLTKGAESSADDALDCTGKGEFYVNSGQVFGWTAPYSTDAIVLELTMKDYNDAREYYNKSNISIGTASQFSVGSSYNVAAFKSDAESSISDYIIKFNYASADIHYDNSLFVVDEVMTGYNPDEGISQCLVSGYLKGVSSSFWVDDDFDKKDEIKALKKGDIIRLNKTSSNKVIQYEPVLKCENEKYITSSVRGEGLTVSTGNSITLLCGYVYSVDNTLVCTNRYDAGTVPKDLKNINWNTLITNGELRYTNLTSDIPVVVVDMERDEVRTGSAEDLLDYENMKDDCSLFFARFRSGRLNEVVIYNK